MIKTDPNGHIGPDVDAAWIAGGGSSWVKLYDNQYSGTNTDEEPYGLEEDANNYILVGYGWHVDGDAHILKINKTNGAIVDQKRYGTPKPGVEIFHDVAKNGSGGWIITGLTDSAGPDGSTANAFFINLNSNLQPIGSGRAYDENLQIERGPDIKPTSSGCALAVWEQVGNDFLLLQTDSSGTLDLTSTRRYGDPSRTELLFAFDTTADEGLILGGYASSEYLGSGGYNWLIAKVDSAGGFTCAPDISGDPIALTSTDFSVDEVLDAGNPIPLTALTISSANLDDVDVGPTGLNKIFRTSAASISTLDNCN
jgi:hypothetical protein